MDGGPTYPRVLGSGSQSKTAGTTLGGIPPEGTEMGGTTDPEQGLGDVTEYSVHAAACINSNGCLEEYSSRGFAYTALFESLASQNLG